MTYHNSDKLSLFKINSDKFPQSNIKYILERGAYKIENALNMSYSIYDDECIFECYIDGNNITIIYKIDYTYEKYISGNLISKGSYYNKYISFI